MSKYSSIASHLQSSLELKFLPVAVVRVIEPPTDVPRFGDAVPSACTFWRRAEQGLFYADAEAHMGCLIGAMVMGFELSESKTEELTSLVGDMCAVAYLEESEVPQIPKFDVGVAGVVYGPLSEFNHHQEPDVVLVWVTPRQAMLLEETVGGTRWTSGNGGSILGRPACGALPRAHDSELAALSLGCAGMRTFTEIPDEYVLVTIPQAQLEHLKAALDKTMAANGQMTITHQAMKSSV
jgi:uncharacterized protein (DUF169 family)